MVYQGKPPVMSPRIISQSKSEINVDEQGLWWYTVVCLKLERQNNGEEMRGVTQDREWDDTDKENKKKETWEEKIEMEQMEFML